MAQLNKMCECCSTLRKLDILDSRYKEILYLCFSITIDDEEGYYICDNCSSILIETEAFRRQIVRSQESRKAKLLSLQNNESTQKSEISTNNSYSPSLCEEPFFDNESDNENSIKLETSATNNCLNRENHKKLQEIPITFQKSDIETNDELNFETEIGYSTDNIVLADLCPIKGRKKLLTKKIKDIPINEMLPKLDKRTLICHICEEQQPTLAGLNMHMNKHYANYICETCGKGFITEMRLTAHVRSHNPIPSTCKDCGQMFRNKSSLMSHRNQKHSGIKPNKCQLCGERFSYRYEKIKHLAAIHGQTEKKYKCPHCPLAFFTASWRTAHMYRKHLVRERRHICEICGAGYFDKTSLSEHRTAHTGDRPFKCSECGKSYPRRSTLRLHMRIHENVKRFSCDVCGRAFTQKCSLKGHMKVHEKEGIVEKIF